MSSADSGARQVGDDRGAVTSQSLTAPTGADGRRWWVRWDLRYPVLLWLVHRVLLQGVGAVVVALHGVPRYSRGGWAGTFFNWDSGWFACIARNGYFGSACDDGATSQRFAFFPLYPLASRGVAWLGGGGELTEASVVLGLWFVAAVGSLVAVVAFHGYAREVTDPATARRATLLFAFGPYTLFLVASYSEALYLAAALTAWLLCLRRRYLGAGLAGALASLSRASGLFLVPALLVLYLVTTRQSGRRLRWRDAVCVGISGLGVVGYWGWLAVRTGDPLAWFHAQDEGWNRITQWPWLTLVNQGVHVLREPRWDWQVQAVLEVLFAGAICFGFLVLLRRRDWPSATLIGLTALSLMTSNSYLSLARNTLTLFPLVLLLAQARWLARSRSTLIVLAASLLLLLYNTVLFAAGFWAD